MASQGFVFIRFGLYALNVTSVSKVEKEKKKHLQLIKYLLCARHFTCGILFDLYRGQL